MLDTTDIQPALSLWLRGLDIDETPVLGSLEFELRPQETVAITGPSGIGKTTFLRTLAGLQAGFHGTLAPAERLAMVFQEPCLLPWYTSLKNLTLTTGISEEAAHAALAEVGLGERALHRPPELSLGQQRRLSLARAFAVKPTVLLMDEPFVSLDRDTADLMIGLFKRLRDRHQVATVLVTHDPNEAKALSERVLILSGSPARFE